MNGTILNRFAPKPLALGLGPVWSVAAFAQGFTAKGMPTGNRPIP
jgi:hypothetical protein